MKYSKMAKCSYEKLFMKKVEEKTEHTIILKKKNTSRNGHTLNSLVVKYFWCLNERVAQGLFIEDKLSKSPLKYIQVGNGNQNSLGNINQF